MRLIVDWAIRANLWNHKNPKGCMTYVGKKGAPRPASTYRGARRNHSLGRV